MRSDLLHAKAAVDWAEANIQSLEERLNTWLTNHVGLEIEEHPDAGADDLVVAVEKEPLPALLNVEVGAYINSIRSSLDILAMSLAERVGGLHPNDVQFPIVVSESDFVRGAYKGSKLMKALPPRERETIEALKPYQGGNVTLWALHHLDIVRKHRRLLAVTPSPGRFEITAWVFTPVATGWIRASDRIILGLVPKGVPKPIMSLLAFVTIEEHGFGRKPVHVALKEFADLANSIITRFDT